MKFFSFLALSILCFVSACNKPAPTSPNALFNQKIAGVDFVAKIALTDMEKARGLMAVEALNENEGMIFVSDIPSQASFWMKNTQIALDIAFVDALGEILQIRKMYPHDENSVKSSATNVLYCVEMNQGWFEKNNIKSGDKIDMNLLLKAIKARRGE